MDNVPPLPDSRKAHPLLRELQDRIRTIGEKLDRLHDALQSIPHEKAADRLLNREEAADRLRISTRTLDDMAAAGEIQPVRIRGRVLYHPDTLDAFIRRHAGEGRA